MTIAEAIVQLQQLPQDARLYVRGYEGGVDDFVSMVEVAVYRHENEGLRYVGQHGVTQVPASESATLAMEAVGYTERGYQLRGGVE